MQRGGPLLVGGWAASALLLAARRPPSSFPVKSLDSSIAVGVYLSAPGHHTSKPGERERGGCLCSENKSASPKANGSSGASFPPIHQLRKFHLKTAAPCTALPSPE